MPRLNEIDKRLLDSMTGRAKLDALLTDLGYPTVRTISQAMDESYEDVSRCLNGRGHDRKPTMSRIRDKLADLAGIKRETVDELLGGPLTDEAA